MKKFAFLFVLLLLALPNSAFASVTNYANFHALAGSIDFGAGEYGLVVKANNDVYLENVIMDSDPATISGISYVRVISYSDQTDILGSAAFSGTTATFSGSGIELAAGEHYYILVYNSSNHLTSKYGSVSADLPSDNTDIKFEGSAYGNAVYRVPFSSDSTGSITEDGGNQIGIYSLQTSANESTSSTSTPPRPTDPPPEIFWGQIVRVATTTCDYSTSTSVCYTSYVPEFYYLDWLLVNIVIIFLLSFTVIGFFMNRTLRK